MRIIGQPATGSRPNGKTNAMPNTISKTGDGKDNTSFVRSHLPNAKMTLTKPKSVAAATTSTTTAAKGMAVTIVVRMKTRSRLNPYPKSPTNVRRPRLRQEK